MCVKVRTKQTCLNPHLPMSTEILKEIYTFKNNETIQTLKNILGYHWYTRTFKNYLGDRKQMVLIANKVKRQDIGY